MKASRELKIKDWSGHIFKEMVNILDIEPEYFMVNDFKGCKNGSILFNLCYSDKTVPHIVFNDIESIFKKSGIYSYLIFCESDKNKDMIYNYVRIIDQRKKEIISWDDRLEEDDSFTLGNDFMRFRFRTDDNLPYNQKINVKVCVISLSSVIKRGSTYYPQFRLQKCFYEYEIFKKIIETASYIKSSSSQLI